MGAGLTATVAASLGLVLSGCSAEPRCADLDADGWCALSQGGADCDDLDAGIHPGAQEICGDGVDQDCSGEPDDLDLDSDGHVHLDCGGDDCDDMDPSVSPSAAERCGDERDQDCSGDPDDADLDGDGHIDEACGGDDCDDDEQYVNPERLERCDGLDNDCDGALGEGEDDADGDGYLACADDCDDSAAWVHPGAHEGDDGTDSDCDSRVCSGTSGQELARCLLTWLSRYDDPIGCEVDLRAMDAGQPAIEAALHAAMGVGGPDDAPAGVDVCLEAVAAVDASLAGLELQGFIEPVCIQGDDGEHLLVLRELHSATRGGLAVLRLSGWRPRSLADGVQQDLVIGAPQRDHIDPPACGDADLYTFYMGLRALVESDVPRAFLANGFPRGALNPTGTGAESALDEALPGLLESRGVAPEHWPNRAVIAANDAGVYYALANPVDGSVRDVLLAVSTERPDALPHCVFGHPDYIGPDGHPCDISDEVAPYLDDIRSLQASDGWLVALDAGSQPTLFALSLLASGAAEELVLRRTLAELPEDGSLCEPGSMAISGDDTLFVLDAGGSAWCGDGGARILRLPLHLEQAGLGTMITMDEGLSPDGVLAADAQGNLLVATAGPGRSQDLQVYPLAASLASARETLLVGDDCRLVDSRFGNDHSLESVVSLGFTPSGLLLMADLDGAELFGALLERGLDGAVQGIQRLAETDLDDGGSVAVALVAQDDQRAWALVDSGEGPYEIVAIDVYSRGDLLQAGNLEERGRMSPYHHYLQAFAREAEVLHLQLHGYDEEDPTHAPLEIPGLQPEPFHWAALISPGLPWGVQTDGFVAAVHSFQQAFAASGSELVYPYPSCVTHHELGARTNRQGQLLNYGELQEGLDGLALHYGDPTGAPPSDELIHIEWPRALRERIHDSDSAAAGYFLAAIEGLVEASPLGWACPFVPDDDLPELPQDCSR
jgi:hypothetical protein